MTLDAYMITHKLTNKVMSVALSNKKIKIAPSTIAYWRRRQRDPSVTAANRIVEYTKGEVSHRELEKL